MNESPYSRSTLMQALASVEAEVAAFFGSLSQDEFVLRVDSAWTPAQHLDHLNISVSAVARGFSISRWLLRLRFGRARRVSRSYEQLRDDYRARLSAGGGATGRYVPTVEELPPEQRSVRQQELLARWQRVNARLRAALERWSEKQLDRIQLPHPLLGKLTAREMVFFTIYHNQHHVTGAKSRLPRFTKTT
ncbi:MAG TPA: DinB family protein [Longimicrobiales bacterium]